MTDAPDRSPAREMSSINDMMQVLIVVCLRSGVRSIRSPHAAAPESPSMTAGGAEVDGLENRPRASRMRCAAVEHIGGTVQPDPGMPVLRATPAEELVTEHPGVLDGRRPVGEVGPILQGLELMRRKRWAR